MKEEYVLSLSRAEQGLLVKSLMDFRNGCLRDDKPVEDVNALLLKAVNASPGRRKWVTREER